MDSEALVQLQDPSTQAALRAVLLSGQPVQDEALALLRQLLPQAVASIEQQQHPQQPVRPQDATVKAALHCVFRRACLDLAAEAQQKGQAPLQYVPAKGSQPALQRLLQVALLACNLGLSDAGLLFSLLEELSEVITPGHCLDMIGWLEQHRPLLNSDVFITGNAVNALTRLCNGILRRLGRHQVIATARLMMLIASTAALADRSGLNVMGVFVAPDAPKPEEVPPGAVDSAGNPVNVLLYTQFWELQGLLQDPLSLLASADKWSIFKKQLTAVLEELAKAPATVPAARTAAAAAPAAASSAAQASLEAASEAAAAVAAAAADDEGDGTQCYLSSWRLFGLQLTDSSFRRDFLVQVLIVLRSLLLPGKVPAEGLKPKQRLEALALEEQVYKVLEATPRDGAKFCRAVREVLAREVTWVLWKKGGKDLVVPGKEPPAAAAAAAGPAGKKPPVPTNCIEWSKPPVPSIAEAVAAAQKASARQAAQKRQRYEDGLSTLQQIADARRTYDNNGEPFEAPYKMRRRTVNQLGPTGCSSALHLWALRHVGDRSLKQQPLLAGLEVAQQPYPTPEALCAQVMREMDPECGILQGDRRLADDGIFRWRVGRVVAQLSMQPDTLAGVDKPEGLQEAMHELFPHLVPPAAAEERRKRIEEKKAAAADKAKGGGSAAAAAASSKLAATTETGAAAAAAASEATAEMPAAATEAGGKAAEGAAEEGTADAAPEAAAADGEGAADEDGEAAPGDAVMAAMEAGGGDAAAAAVAMDVDAAAE
ncbi:hypothetical protein OEZ86_008881 [Tetradesmus obliquus]|nr:hypothetical protein OEZ86_008881 [Tetradesmus obliquus]